MNNKTNTKKIYLVTSFLLIVALTITAYQYYGAISMEFVSAGTKPANGHLWSEMESGSDSIQVSGRTITNLTAPINLTDATNKEYVDAAGGGMVTYANCYIINKKTAGLACASGFTTLATFNPSTCCWTYHSSVGSNGAYIITGVGGGNVKFGFGGYNSSGYQRYGQCMSDLDNNEYSAFINVDGLYVFSTIGPDIVYNGACQNKAHTLSVCCK